jgi:hypothetical protein
LIEEIERFRIAFGEQLFEIAFESEMPAEQHVGIDVAPDFRKVGNLAHAPIEIGRGRNRDAGADFRAARGPGIDDRRGFHGSSARRRENVRADDHLTPGRVNQLIHNAQAGHRVFRVERGRSIRRTDARGREFFRQRSAAHQQRDVHAVILEIRRG